MRRRRALGLVALAVLGAAISAELAAYQLGIVPRVWDPIFGDAALRVLTSPLSRALPVPDAVVGFGGYAVDTLLGILLIAGLWRPSIVAAILAIVTVVGAAVAVALAIAQPLVAHAGCTLCLCSTLVSIGLAAGALVEAHERWPGLRRPVPPPLTRSAREESR